MQRLLRLSKALRSVVEWESEALIAAAGTKDEAPKKAKIVISIIKDNQFWEDLAW